MIMTKFQTTDGRLFQTSDTAANLKSYWESNKKSLRWFLAFDEEGQTYFWHEGHKYWQHFDRLDDKVKAVYRRLLQKYYLEAVNNGVDMEHIPSLNNPN